MKKTVLTCLSLIMLALIPAASAADDIVSAAAAGNLTQVKALIEKDSSCLKTADPSGRTALHTAAYAGQGSVVEYLLSRGASLAARDNKDRTPLHLAAYGGHAEIVKMLLTAGADKTAVDRAGKKPIEAAMARNHTDLIPLLLDDEVVHVAGNVYRISAFTGHTNITVSSGSDGILVVDTGLAPIAESLLARIMEFGKGKPKIVINTHQHASHTGGNPAIVGDAVLIDTASLEKHATDGLLQRGTKPIRGYGDLSFDTYYTLRFNGEDIRLIHLSGGHTPADLIVQFVDSSVVAMQDVLDSQSFPPIRENVQSWMEEIDRAVATMPAGTIFIAGHGRDLRLDELREYRRTIQESVDAVRERIRAGKTLEELGKENVLKPWAQYGEFLPALNVDYWLAAIYRSYPEDQPKSATP